MKRKVMIIFLAGMMVCSCMTQNVSAAGTSAETVETKQPAAETDMQESADGASDAEKLAEETESKERDTEVSEETRDKEEVSGDIENGEDNVENPGEGGSDEADEKQEADVSQNGLAVTGNQLMMASNALSYTYDPGYVSAKVSTIGGVSFSSIVSATKTVIVKNEGSYTSVNANDVGALSIGCMQWHANRARNLLRTIISMDNGAAYDVLGSSLYNEIIKSSTDWSSRTLTSDEANRVSKLLGTTNGTKAQDNLAQSDITTYINNGYTLGITNAAALIYYADIENQSGAGVSKRCGNYAYNLVKSWSKVTLNELHLATICYCYSGSNAYLKNETNRGIYVNRRRKTYGYAAGLGWTYCNKGDYQIPWDSTGANGAAWLQKTLNDYQNAGLTVDGTYGELTKAAVKKFQEYAGLTVDGWAGRDTSSTLICKRYYEMAINGAATLGTMAVTTDIVKDEQSGQWRYCVNGVFDSTYTGVAKNSHGWWYVKNGVVDFTYNGFAENQNGWWYLENGKVTFQKNDILKGTVKGENAWWYIKASKVTFTNTVAKNKNGWWYVENGKVNFSYNGFAENSNGWWYLEKGKVTFQRNDILKGSVKGGTAWWYIKNSKVTFTDTVAKNKNGWWCVENGKVNFNYNGIAQNQNGWWVIRNGKVDFQYNGWITVKSGRYWVVNGKVRR